LDSPKQSRKSSLRLHKYLAECGVGSRRACERLIAEGRVALDGKIIVEQGVCLDPERQVLCLDGRPVKPQSKVYILLNKPRDVLCTSHDPQNRRTFLAFVPDLPQRIYTVGRLDRNSEGLLLLTNDGELANMVMHPRHGVEKIYQVWIKTRLTADQERRLLEGIMSEGELLRTKEVAQAEGEPGKFVYRLRLVEGRNRHIRRMFEALGVSIARLKRVALGPIRLKNMRSGAWRFLEEQEVRDLWSCAGKIDADKRYDRLNLTWGRPWAGPYRTNREVWRATMDINARGGFHISEPARRIRAVDQSQGAEKQFQYTGQTPGNFRGGRTGFRK
jgi:23S rRNA pseudouridine2605 synthase